MGAQFNKHKYTLRAQYNAYSYVNKHYINILFPARPHICMFLQLQISLNLTGNTVLYMFGCAKNKLQLLFCQAKQDYTKDNLCLQYARATSVLK